MVSTYHLIKLLQNASARTANYNNGNKVSYKKKIKFATSAANAINQTCRVCLHPGAIPIFSKNNFHDFPLVHYLKLICEIDITANDVHPQYLCKPCKDTLDAAIKLRNTAKETQLKLREISSSNQILNINYIETDNELDNPEVTLPAQKEEETTMLMRKEIDFNLDKKEDLKKSDAFSQQHKELKTTDEQYEKYFKQAFTNENKAVYQCQICKNVYKKLSLAAHLITHLPDTESGRCVYQYVCEVCGKTFKKYCNFYLHRTIHSNVLPYKCNSCPYKGRYKNQLQGHIKRVHKKEYNYQCTLCPRKFLDSNSLKRHLLRHCEPKFQCSTCHKKFYENSILKYHVQIHHTGDTALHSCDICGNSYKRRRNLLVHQIKAHKRQKIFNNRATYLKLENATKSNQI